MKEEITQILEERYGELRSLTSDEFGMAHKVYFAETESLQKVVIKAGKGNYSKERLQREPAVLKLLENIDYPAPRLLAEDMSGEKHDFIYFVMTKEDGKNIDSFSSGPKFKRIEKQRKNKLLEHSGDLLGRLHSSTGFQDYGELYYKNTLEVKSRESWSLLLMDLVEKHSLEGMKDSRFSDLIDDAREFLEENIVKLDTGDQPRLVHQDFRFGNLLVTDDRVNTVLDWERAISGHREYDLFKAERNLIAKFKTDSLREEYRKKFLNGYRKHLELDEGWESRREIYQMIYLMEAMWTFSDWSEEIPEGVTSELESNMRKEFNRRIDGETTVPFSSMSI